MPLCVHVWSQGKGGRSLRGSLFGYLELRGKFQAVRGPADLHREAARLHYPVELTVEQAQLCRDVDRDCDGLLLQQD